MNTDVTTHDDQADTSAEYHDDGVIVSVANGTGKKRASTRSKASEHVAAPSISDAEARLSQARVLLASLQEGMRQLEQVLLLQNDDLATLHEVESVLARQQELLARQPASSYTFTQSYQPSYPDTASHGGRSMDGVFNGEFMMGEDGKAYPVPANYASKSKLVEGDLLRLFITVDGRYIFKQRGPSERQRVMATVAHDTKTDTWTVTSTDGKVYKVLTAAMTFYRAQHGDDAVILIPRDIPAQWAAVENIVRKNLSDFGNQGIA